MIKKIMFLSFIIMLAGFSLSARKAENALNIKTVLEIRELSEKLEKMSDQERVIFLAEIEKIVEDKCLVDHVTTMVILGVRQLLLLVYYF